MTNYSLPKPLNYVNGKYMIEYIINNIPTDEIYIIYNIYLAKYNFEEIIINLFKQKKFIFSTVDYLTRGPVETAFIGINKFNLDIFEESIVFLDNDNLHNYEEIPLNLSNNFISYCIDTDINNNKYSYILIENNKIIEIAEKKKISDTYCCGMYGFKNIEIFNKYAKEIILKNIKIKNEYYFSKIYEKMIDNNELILPIYISDSKHIGSLNEINKNKTFLNNKLRFCFDIDNTLVTYPTIPNDYSTVKPIYKMINLLNYLKEQGHYIILHTARRMKTHDNNVGKVIKDIACVTINTLEKFNIYYDELIFGKPLADIYIDDRSLNPYINDISYFGIFDINNNEYIHNKVNNNKYNEIKKINNEIIKTGPIFFMKGEYYFYKNIPNNLLEYFPKLINYNIIDSNKSILNIEYIDGIPLYFLHKNKLIT